jgi:hypothetical protein
MSLLLNAISGVLVLAVSACAACMVLALPIMFGQWLWTIILF